jgi:hypothetical protein
MLGGAREFRYDWILLRARNLPHEAGGNTGPIILRGGKRLAVRPARLSAARSSECRNDRRFPPPWSVDHSPSTRRVCSARISSAMLVRDRRKSSANGAFGRHEPTRQRRKKAPR